MKLGVDVGSTTIKIVLLNQDDEIVYKSYTRHKTDFYGVLTQELEKIDKEFPNDKFQINITGSAGMGISETMGISFVQEVIASVEVVRKYFTETYTLIDLGGEDSKMVFFEPGKQADIRMNGSCAGGTGAFIDQMADLMNIKIEDLGKEALKYDKLYPIASRCGVFAKTDVQNLIARNINKANISMSILQAVALQSITTLARGYDIKPKVLFIGGPLTFIPALRNSFRNLLKLDEKDFIVPENGEYFPAWGAALLNKEDGKEYFLKDIYEIKNKLDKKRGVAKSTQDTLPRLFEDEEEYLNWKNTRKIKKLSTRELQNAEVVELFLGIDSGSTTTKILIMDKNKDIVYTFYASNEGNPLKKAIEGLQKFYDEVKQKQISFNFLASCCTGYGEDLIKQALGLDYGIIETMAHLQGAQYIDNKVSFVLDIGGQDMKSIFINNGVISNIELNEACSSGCGSFLQNFASTMNSSLQEFSEKACLAKNPQDLGSRCTVFMNSKVKQSIKENASLGDISAGLAYSVVKNCLFKVLKISNLNNLGENIVVQGGTFRNDAVFRALELISEKSVSSTDRPELMGAFGSALYALKMQKLENRKTTFSGKEPLIDLSLVKTKELQCYACSNNCPVISFQFENGNISYAGNKCEKVFYNKNSALKKGYNAFDFKNKLLFDRVNNNCNVQENSIKIGIPRALNMFENFPFWHTLFTECGLNVILSPQSTYPLYQKGVGSVMSENICFPAKLVHGHIMELIEAKVDRIFYPIVPKDEKEFKNSSNSFNCPIVSGYPDVIKSSIDPESKFDIPFDNPVISFHDNKILKKSSYNYLASLGIEKNIFEKAFKKAVIEKDKVRQIIKDTQKEILEKCIENEEIVFILCGRPYHSDPLIHQKVGQILSDLGANALTDDIFIGEESDGFENLNMVSQWVYSNRGVQSALKVGKMPKNVQLIQLNSFGCGPDSFTIDEIGNILKHFGKNNTVLKIDEITSSGSIRLRLRSLIESLKATKIFEKNEYFYTGYNSFYTEKDKQKTILVPWFSDFLSPFLPAIGKLAGYQLENCPKTSKKSAEIGLKYGNNEVCYPATLVLGDLISTLQSGKYDLKNVVVGVTQTGGQCRATNYVAQIKLGLKNAGFENIPVITLTSGESFQNKQDFKIPIFKLADIMLNTLLYGAALQQFYSSSVIREKNKGESKGLFDTYIEKGVKEIEKNDSKALLRLLSEAVNDFNNISIYDKEYLRVGLVGEIFVKYNNYGQANITKWLQEKNIEVVAPSILDFLMQVFVNQKINIKNGLEGASIFSNILNPFLYSFVNKKVLSIEKIMEKYRFYYKNESIFTKAKYAEEILDLSNQFGEGWLIPAEIACFAREGIDKIICIQPFGCIANQVVAKGVEKRMKKFYPNINLLFLDMDSGVAEVNLHNRLHFLVN